MGRGGDVAGLSREEGWSASEQAAEDRACIQRSRLWGCVLQGMLCWSASHVKRLSGRRMLCLRLLWVGCGLRHELLLGPCAGLL